MIGSKVVWNNLNATEIEWPPGTEVVLMFGATAVKERLSSNVTSKSNWGYPYGPRMTHCPWQGKAAVTPMTESRQNAATLHNNPPNRHFYWRCL
jgi:hypothetical protein